MMQRASSFIEKLNPRLALALALLIFSGLAAEGWLLLLRKPYAEYRQITATHVSLDSSLSQSPDHASELSRLALELKQLTEQLSGELSLPASDDKMAASLMEALDRSASAHSIVLSGVKPLERKQVSVFEEVSFDITAKGAYLQLCDWMLNFNKTLGNNATVTEFDMKSADEGKHVTLTLKVALYRPLKLNGAAK